MLMDAVDSQLVLIDYQDRLLPAMFEGQACVDNAMRLAQAAHLLGVPVWGTEQNPSKLGNLPAAMKAMCAQTLAKMQFSACEEGLIELLRPDAHAKPPQGNARSLPKHLQKPAAPASGRSTVLLAGIEAHVCLLQTALDLLEDEFEVWVVTDACSSRTERNRDAAFDRLAGAGIELVTTEMVLFEWLQTAAHPHFKDIQALIK
jgi:nicotinamidase-related amidase